MRLDKTERMALRHAFKDFKGSVYLYGSRLDDNKRGGDIDLLIMPESNLSSLKLTIETQRRFFLKCEQKLDVVVYKEDKPFCQEILKHAQKIDIAAL